jgi:hypothetical protein
MGTSFTKLRLFFHKFCFFINTPFPLLRYTLYGGHWQLLAAASDHLHARCVTAHRPQNSVLRVQPLWGREDGIWKVINRCLNFLNVCTYRCVLMVAHLSKNSTNKFSSLYQKTLIMTWHTPSAPCNFSCVATTDNAITLTVFPASSTPLLKLETCIPTRRFKSPGTWQCDDVTNLPLYQHSWCYASDKFNLVSQPLW